MELFGALVLAGVISFVVSLALTMLVLWVLE